MSFMFRAIPALLLPALLAMAPALQAQDEDGPRPSQHGGVIQELHLTRILMEYDRPVARGRDLFGGIVNWDEIWTPGANRATWIELSTNVTVDGHEVAAGRYGIWLVPRAAAPWEVVLVSDWDRHHLRFPEGSEVLRFEVAPVEAAHIETLTWYFPSVEGYEGVLWMHWGTTALPLTIRAPGGGVG